MRASVALPHVPQVAAGSVAARLSTSCMLLAASFHPATDFPAARHPPNGPLTVPVWPASGPSAEASRAPSCGFLASSAATKRTERALRPALTRLEASERLFPPRTRRQRRREAAPAVEAVEAGSPKPVMYSPPKPIHESHANHDASARHRRRHLGHSRPDARALGRQTVTVEAPRNCTCSVRAREQQTGKMARQTGFESPCLAAGDLGMVW